jgi:hypothetical protein
MRAATLQELHCIESNSDRVGSMLRLVPVLCRPVRVLERLEQEGTKHESCHSEPGFK